MAPSTFISLSPHHQESVPDLVQRNPDRNFETLVALQSFRQVQKLGWGVDMRVTGPQTLLQLQFKTKKHNKHYVLDC